MDIFLERFPERIHAMTVSEGLVSYHNKQSLLIDLGEDGKSLCQELFHLGFSRMFRCTAIVTLVSDDAKNFLGSNRPDFIDPLTQDSGRYDNKEWLALWVPGEFSTADLLVVESGQLQIESSQGFL